MDFWEKANFSFLSLFWNLKISKKYLIKYFYVKISKQLFWLTFLHETIMIFIKVLDKYNRTARGKTVKISSTGMKGSSSHSTGADGVVQFNMDPGEYRVSINGKYIVTQYLNETDNTFHIMRWCSVCIQKLPPVRGDFFIKNLIKK